MPCRRSSKLTEQPEALGDRREVVVGFRGTDDRTPAGELTFIAELFRVPDGGGLPYVAQQQTLQGAGGTVRFARVSEGVYRARVTARDLAGNVTSEDVGLVIVDTACQATGHGQGGPSLMLSRRRHGLGCHSPLAPW